MSINQVIIYIMLIFMAIGAIDKAFLKDRLGFGPQFEEGINAMGPLAMSMVGIMCLAPVLGNLLAPIVGPVYRFLRADPAMFAGTLLAIDMGGLPLALEMTSDLQIANFSGVILGSMMGATIVFSIPVSLGIVEEKDKPFLAKGILAGMIAIPIGCFVGGLISGMDIMLVVANLIPVIIIAILLAIGLALIPNGMMKGFDVFSKFITIVITLAFAAAIIGELSGGVIAVPGMAPIGPQLESVGIIAITLAGAYPLVHFITKVLSKPLAAVGKLIGVNEVTIGGMIAALANNIPMFGMLKDMDNRGKVIAVAFSVPAAFALGDHLGFTSGNAPDYIFPMIAAKIIGGIFAVVIAFFFVPKAKKEDVKAETKNTAKV